MTESYPDSSAVHVRTGQQLEKYLLWLLAARVALALIAIYLIFFLLQWSSAVRREEVPGPRDQQVPEHWKVVIPQYAGTGRGSTLTGVKPWKFGTMEEHPIQVGLCVALVVAVAGAFAWCTWYASRLKGLKAAEVSSACAEDFHG